MVLSLLLPIRMIYGVVSCVDCRRQLVRVRTVHSFCLRLTLMDCTNRETTKCTVNEETDRKYCIDCCALTSEPLSESSPPRLRLTACFFVNLSSSSELEYSTYDDKSALPRPAVDRRGRPVFDTFSSRAFLPEPAPRPLRFLLALSSSDGGSSSSSASASSSSEIGQHSKQFESLLYLGSSDENVFTRVKTFYLFYPR